MTDRTSRNLSPPLPASNERTRSQRNSFSQSQRPDSEATQVLHQPQPLRDAISQTVDEGISQQPPVDARQEEALVDRITQAVLEKLTTNISGITAGLANATTQPQPIPQPSPRFQAFDAPRSVHSPTYSSEASIPGRYTPPSPSTLRTRQSGSVGSPVNITSGRSDVTSPEPAFSGSEFDIDEQTQSMTTEREEKSGSQNSTVVDDTGSKLQPDLRPRKDDSRWRRMESPARAAMRSRRESSAQRRSPPQSSAPIVDDGPTIVEQAWQPLFDRNGNPVERLGHYLRGLANHLIEDWKPENSLVVTPAKMLKYFDTTKVDDEQYPWQVIFEKVADPSLSTIYSKLVAQHHLVQTANHSAPCVPALTPRGFETFMSCLIQAHPEHEYKRINRTVQLMPIASAEDRSFRFPKELPRRLLPERANVQAAQRLASAMGHEPKIRLRNAPMMPPPPPAQPSVQSDRERRPTGRRSHSNAVDDDDLSTAMPIERERKPYTAREGSGKNFDLDLEWDAREPLHRYDDMPRPTRHNSNGSNDGRGMPTRHRLSTGPGTVPPVTYDRYTRGTGRRSPPLSNSYSKSDVGIPDLSQYIGSSRASSDVGIDDRRSSRRQTVSSAIPGAMDIDPRGKPISSRNGVGQDFDSSYGSMPPQLPPISTSFDSRRGSHGQYEERRRSAYPTAPGGDGWSGQQGDYGGGGR